jgi:hypothetical protein
MSETNTLIVACPHCGAARDTSHCLTGDVLKQCSKCGECKPRTAEHFFRLATSSDGLRPDCKACCRVPAKEIPLADRFWRNVDASGECWEWRGHRMNHGYGSIVVGGKRILAHRLAYELTYGPIPDGLDILHHCDNPGCVRPEHLRAGTHTENMQDKMARGRANHLRGDQNPNARLTSKQVAEIRALHAEGRHTHRQIASLYGVDRSTITAVLRRKNWKET